MRVGIFGGTFDPVHHGHLLLARDACEQWSLDLLYLVPCHQSPHKQSPPLATGLHRMEMIRRAIAGENGWTVSGCEVRRAGPSFAVETAAWFAKRHPSDHLCWLLGEDQREKLPTWHQFQELSRMVEFCFMSRGGQVGGVTRQVDLSSTEVRRRAGAGQSIKWMVPEAVLRYIRRHRLYQQEDR